MKNLTIKDLNKRLTTHNALHCVLILALGTWVCLQAYELNKFQDRFSHHVNKVHEQEGAQVDKDIIWLQDNDLRIEEQQVDLREQVESMSQELLLLQQSRTRIVRVTAYHPKNKTGALATPIVTGRTAAISPKCRELLGRTVYVPNHGVWVIEDLTSPTMDKVHKNVCTLDLAIPDTVPTSRVGNKQQQITLID